MLGLLKPFTDFYQSMITSPNNRLVQLLYYLSRDLWGPYTLLENTLLLRLHACKLM